MKIAIVTGLLLLVLKGYTQVIDSVGHRESTTMRKNEKSDQNGEQTVNNLKGWFVKGHFGGLIRNSFMATINQRDLKDYWANGTGGRLYYHTSEFKGFQIGLGGLFVFNTGSSDLTEADPVVGKGSRWEVQLFDITDPSNKDDMDRLEELFLKYRYKKSWIKLGKMGINTPLVNKQDTRLKPTVLSGVWAEINEWKNVSVSAGWFTKSSPRSTTAWYDLEAAIGLYGKGCNPDGTKSGYAGNITTNGLGILGIDYNFNDRLEIQIWDYYIENILNAGFFQTDYHIGQYELGFQYLREDQINAGGNSDPARTYFPSGHTTNLFSLKAGIKKSKWSTSFNYTQGLNTGRFLFPRELGTARLYTYISRHRVEGLGDFQTFMMKFNYFPLDDSSLNVGVYVGRTNSNDMRDFELNKYGFMSYNQLNIDLNYALKGWLAGLDVRALYVLDTSFDKSIENPDYVFNKTNLSHVNIMATLNF